MEAFDELASLCEEEPAPQKTIGPELRKASRWRPDRTGREAMALLTASVLHVGLLALGRLELRGAPSSQRSQSSNELEVGLWEQEERPFTQPSHGRQAEPTARHESPRTPALTRRATRSLPAPANEVGEEPSSTNEPEAVASAAGPQDYSPPGPGRPIDLGVGADDWRRWVRDTQSGEPEPRRRGSRGRPLVRAPPASSTGGLQEGLEQRDRELGLSPAGGVVSALYQAALAESPRVGHAVFAVTIARAGTVDIAVVQSAGGGPAWQSVAQRAAKSLREKLPRIPSTRSGVRVVLKILTEDVLPSGGKVDERKGLGALVPWVGDLADVGAKPQRVIRTRVQEETMF